MTRSFDDTGVTPPRGAWRSVVGGPDGPQAQDRWWASRPERPPAPLPSTFSASPARIVARALLGKLLLSRVGNESALVRIVETEAYVGRHDPACHGAQKSGRTERNASMFGPPGRAYVYFIYGMHWCMNVVTGEEGDPEAVLVRAAEPLRGLHVMARRRGRDHDLTNGPARLCEALGIDGTLDGHDFRQPALQLLPGPTVADADVEVSGRIGIRRARDWPLRFFIRDHRHVSKGPHEPAARTTEFVKVESDQPEEER